MEKKLSEMKHEEQGTIIRIEKDFREKIAGMGFREGKKIKMMTRHPMKGPIVVTTGRNDTSLGLELAEQIVVEVEK